MEGLCGLKILLLWTGIISLTRGLKSSPTPPHCSYTVKPIKSGFIIDMKNVSSGNYIINIMEEGRTGTVKNLSVQFSEGSSSHEIKPLKPCTDYVHRVAFIDSDGQERQCDENKIQTSKMSRDDIKGVSCIPGYVCYQSDWDISSSLSTPDNVPAERCNGESVCVKPGYEDICSDFTSTFTCGNFSLTTPISVDFLNASEIYQTVPTGLPAEIKAELPPNCNDLTVDYTCSESGKVNDSRKVSELEPFTDYSCTGQIKKNNVFIDKTTPPIRFNINCGFTINITKSSSTNTSMELSWTTTSDNCQSVFHTLQKLSYGCSCRDSSKEKVNKTQIEVHTNQHDAGTCKVAGLKPYTSYTCEVQPSYDNKRVTRRKEFTHRTMPGIPEDITEVRLTLFPDVVMVSCNNYEYHFNGPENIYIAQVGDTVKQETSYCSFYFKDLSYFTNYTLKLTAYNGHFESKTTIRYVYNDTIINFVVGFSIVSLELLLVAAYATYTWRHRKDLDEDMRLKSTAIYVLLLPEEDLMEPDEASDQIPTDSL